MKMGVKLHRHFCYVPQKCKMQGTQDETYSLKKNDSSHFIQKSSINLNCGQSWRKGGIQKLYWRCKFIKQCYVSFCLHAFNINKDVLYKSYNSYEFTLIIQPFVSVNIGFGFLVLPLLQENWSILNRNKQTCEILESRNSIWDLGGKPERSVCLQPFLISGLNWFCK